MKKLSLCLILFCFIVNIWADIESGAGTPPNITPGYIENVGFKAPQNPGSALIIYCPNSADRDRYSESAMETFRAALAHGAKLDNGQTLNGLDFIYNKGTMTLSIPPIDPPLMRVNILPIAETGQGIDKALYEKFKKQGQSTRDGFEFNEDLFEELYANRNPLSYWSQVYDLRFSANSPGYNKEDNQTAATITTPIQKPASIPDDKIDFSYFREHLRTGGTLFLQDEYNAFTNRNKGVAQVIKNFTLDKNYSENAAPAGAPDKFVSNFSFHDDFAHFAHDFNNLDSLLRTNPMRWSNPGGIKNNGVYIKNGKPLVMYGGDTIVVAAWGTKEMDPNVGNGILVVAFDINSWGDYGKGIISRTTFALIQNIYDLMDGSKQYTISKNFKPDELDLGEDGTCVITIKNNGNYTIDNIVVTDPLNSCFEFREFTISSKPQITGTQEGATLKWDIGTIDGREEVTVGFKFRIKNTNCAE